MDKYTVNCVNCEEECEAEQIAEDLFGCTNCGFMTNSESGRITNETEKAYYHELYVGAKIAGMIDEPDVPRESKQAQEDFAVDHGISYIDSM